MPQRKTTIDESEIEGYVRNGSTIEEIADYLGVTTRRIERQFARQIARARALRQMHLRKYQWKAAQDGSVQMLIFLGKHEMRQDQEKAANDEKIIVRRYVDRRPIRTRDSDPA